MGLLKRVMPKNYANFNLSHRHDLSCKAGQLVPVLFEEILPGDKWKFNSTVLTRMMPMVRPTLTRYRQVWHFFFVPSRLLMDDWEKFITGGKNRDDATVLPYINSGENGFAVGSLADYFGFPTEVKNLNVLAFPFRAYALTRNYYFCRDDVQEEVPVSMLSGLDTVTNTAVLKRPWSRDRFTNAVVSAQRGEPVYLPLGTSAPVVGNGLLGIKTSSGNVPGAGGLSGSTGYLYKGTEPVGATGEFVMSTIGGNGSNFGVTDEPTQSGLKADLTSASAVEVDAMRYAVQTQLVASILGRYGYRYAEYLAAFFGTNADDGRLQNPQYLGGGSSDMIVSEVLQTSSTDSTSAQGNMAGHGIGGGQSPVINHFFKEHGYVLGLMSIVPDAMYYQGIPRKYLKRTRYDYALPVYAHLGMSPVYKGELFAASTDDENYKTFGFRDIYDEYRSIPNQIHGQLRTTLKNWTEARDFENAPALNAEFVECTPPNRCFAVPGEDNFIVSIQHDILARRPLPKFGDPGYMDHY